MKALFVGLTTVDIQYFVDEFPQSNVKVKTAPPQIYVGGPATNAAIAFSALGGNAQLISFKGKSAMAEVISTDFNQNKIAHTELFPESEQLPVLASVITSKNNGDRNIFTFNPNDEPFQLEEELESLLDGVSLVFSDGFYPNSAMHILKAAKQKGIPTVFDGGSWKEWLPQLLPYIDYAICSNDFRPPNCASSSQVFEFLSQFGICYKAISRGENSILFQKNSEKIDSVLIPITKVVDTLGAGDFLHGAFCHYILNQTFGHSLEQAAKVASFSCQFQGTRKWISEY